MKNGGERELGFERNEEQNKANEMAFLIFCSWSLDQNIVYGSIPLSNAQYSTRIQYYPMGSN